jgi:hypothetical protein
MTPMLRLILRAAARVACLHVFLFDAMGLGPCGRTVVMSCPRCGKRKVAPLPLGVLQ